jgi:NADPH:quinone reductase-like Zn-dependent oxidoreductase
MVVWVNGTAVSLYKRSAIMRAVRVQTGKGDADALFINDNEPDPVPGPGQLLVKIKAFGLNRMDIMQREDKYPYPLLPESGDIMGVEFSGVVGEIGPQCVYLAPLRDTSHDWTNAKPVRRF